VLVLAGCSAGSETSRAEVGEPAPTFSSFDLDGRPVKLADFRGRVVLLNFWASWCAPCRAEFPRLRTVHGDKVAVVGVLYDDRAEPALAFAREHGATWPSVIDPRGEIAKAYGVGPGIPVTWVVDADGVARARHHGELHDADLTRLLDGAAR
jgi:DsbE subfamily thiol:disulfide oxidoreductase